MPYGRYSRRRVFTRRRRTRYMWVRSNEVVVPGTTMSVDLMANWRSTAGVTIQFPDLVIWRLHLKISIRFTYSPATYSAASGVLCAVFVADQNVGALLNPLTNQYTEQYMMWDMLYSAEQEVASDPGVAGQPVIYHEYDIKSHRRLRNIQETLWLQLYSQGNVVPAEVNFTQSALYKLP